MNKDMYKKAINRFTWLIYCFLRFTSRLLSMGAAYRLASIIGRLAYWIVGRHRRTAYESLGVAFPAMSLRKKKEITRGYFIFLAQALIEFMKLLEDPDLAKASVALEGRRNLDKALAGGKGVVIFTAHLGNFPLMAYALACYGYPVNIVLRPLKDKAASDYLDSLMFSKKVSPIYSYPRRECIVSIIEALRCNEIVMIPADQNFGTGGVWVKFFGRLAATPTGPAVLASRAGAPILGAYITREGTALHHVRLLEPIAMENKPDKREAILLNTIKITRAIESWIREHPEHWSWIHKRWKSQPAAADLDEQFRVEK
jgi:Kdo2-lipid IVA lauroyltransferase/acyltransferase